jgi:hypothetical protein
MVAMITAKLVSKEHQRINLNGMVCNVMELNHQYSPVLIKDGVCLILHAVAMEKMQEFPVSHGVSFDNDQIFTPSRPTSTLPCPGVEPTSLTSIPEN